MSKRAKVCSTCGSDDIVVDAWASWDADTQEWVLDNVFDYTFCKACEGETSIEEKEIQ